VPADADAARRPRVVIVGGGFGGLAAARKLRHADADVTLVDRTNHHLFQPLLYQVAAGALSPSDCAAPIRPSLKRSANTTVLMDEVTDIDPERRHVLLAQGDRLDYDSLIVACGARTSYFGQEQWKEVTFGLKTLMDAIELRQHFYATLEEAERSNDSAEQAEYLTFVVVGGGPTGVEIAGELALTVSDMKRQYRRIDTSQAKVILLDGVTIDLQGATERIAARTVIWAAGVRSVPLTDALARATGASTDRGGRIEVNPDLTLPGRPEISVIGDGASLAGPQGKPLPGLATVAIQQAHHVAKAVGGGERGASTPFKYLDKGALAVVGRGKAVCEIRGLKLSGWPAFLTYLGVHLYYLGGQVGRRMGVLLKWIGARFGERQSALIERELASADRAAPPQAVR
jgi:NADH:ubiquinone reductase (H+-translocating)